MPFKIALLDKWEPYKYNLLISMIMLLMLPTWIRSDLPLALN